MIIQVLLWRKRLLAPEKITTVSVLRTTAGVWSRWQSSVAASILLAVLLQDAVDYRESGSRWLVR